MAKLAKHRQRSDGSSLALTDRPAEPRRPWPWQAIGAGLAIVLMTLVAYGPVIADGGFVWDDPDYVVNNPVLRDVGGLARMWTQPSSLPQYYPMVHTTYWVEYQIWGLDPTGYHVNNVLLHAASAVMLWVILRRLGVPGAWVAGAVFAVHPVMVESVAWVTERKNVLSMAFYLAAALAYVRFEGVGIGDQTADESQTARRNRGWYAVALVLFVLALLSKTVTSTWPAAMVLVLWWQRGRISVRDVGRLAPFFVLGVGMGLVTAALERQHVGATGAEWAFSPDDRVVIAGRVVWFYVGKLLWPAKLTFIYPRWDIDPGQAWQWAGAAMTVAVAVVLFSLRNRIGRGWAAGWLFFVGTLFPALGFFNVYPMRYSFVADHFQYHASVGVIATVVALAAWTMRRQVTRRPVPVAAGVVAMVLFALGAATWRQGRIYETAETLWADTLRKNPGSWMVHLNMGHVYVKKAEALEADGRPAEARAWYAKATESYRAALERGRHVADPHWNVGITYAMEGRYDEAIREYAEAIRLDPRFAEAYWSTGNALMERGNLAEAAAWYRQALERKPVYPEAHFNLGFVRERQGDLRGAADAYAAAIAQRPGYAKAYAALGRVLGQSGNLNGAVAQLSEAVRLDPRLVDAQVMLIRTLAGTGRAQEAAAAFEQARSAIPDFEQQFTRATRQGR